MKSRSDPLNQSIWVAQSGRDLGELHGLRIGNWWQIEKNGWEIAWWLAFGSGEHVVIGYHFQMSVEIGNHNFCGEWILLHLNLWWWYSMNQKKTEKWYLKCLCLLTFLKFIHSMLGNFIRDVLMYEPNGYYTSPVLNSATATHYLIILCYAAIMALVRHWENKIAEGCKRYNSIW